MVLTLRQKIGLIMQSLLAAWIIFFEPMLNAPSEGAFASDSIPGETRVFVYSWTVLTLLGTTFMAIVSLKVSGTPLSKIWLCLPPPEKRREVFRSIVNVVIPVVILSALLIFFFPDRVDVATRNISGLLPQTLQEQALWIVVALTAGITEEIIYRGFLINFLDWNFDGKLNGHLAVVLAAAIFGLRHLYQGWDAVFTITLFAIVMGIVARRHQSLVAPMALHVLINVRALFF